MTTTKTPVLTDDDIDALRIKAFQTNSADDRKAYFEATSRYFQDRHYRAMDREQAVLERAGADAVRDAALEEAAVLLDSYHERFDADDVRRNMHKLHSYGPAEAIRALKGTPAAAVPDSMPGWSHWETRIKALMQDMGMPNSHSAYQALAQLANEMGQAHAASVAGQLSGNPGQVADCWSNSDGDTWRDSPDDRDFLDGLKVGDEYELQASIRSWPERFRVIKAPDETSDDYEVEPVDIRVLKVTPAAAVADAQPVYTVEVRGSLHSWTPTAHAFKLANGTHNLYAAQPRAQAQQSGNGGELDDNYRSAFEAWFRSERALRTPLTRDGDGYAFLGTHEDWQVWCAAIAANKGANHG